MIPTPVTSGLARRPTDVIAATYALEGAGFGVFRPFPTAALDLLDPFLLLDEMEPKDYPPGEFKGAIHTRSRSPVTTKRHQSVPLPQGVSP